MVAPVADPALVAAQNMITMGLTTMIQGLNQILARQNANANVPGSGNAQIFAGNTVLQMGITQLIAGIVAYQQRLAQLMAPGDGGPGGGGDGGGGGGGAAGGHLGAAFGFSMADLNAASAGLNALSNGVQADGVVMNGMAPAA